MGVIGHTGRGNYGHGLDVVWNLLDETSIGAVADANEGGLAKVVALFEIRHLFPSSLRVHEDLSFTLRITGVFRNQDICMIYRVNIISGRLKRPGNNTP